PKVIKSWEEELDDLIRFYDYPTVIQRQIYTTNTIERAIKDVKKRLKPMNSLPSESAVEKIIYLLSVEYNEKWAQKKISEFSSEQKEVKSMFEERNKSVKQKNGQRNEINGSHSIHHPIHV